MLGFPVSIMFIGLPVWPSYSRRGMTPHHASQNASSGKIRSSGFWSVTAWRKSKLIIVNDGVYYAIDQLGRGSDRSC